MLTGINGFIRLSLPKYLSEEDAQEIEHKANSIVIMTYSGKEIVLDVDDFEILRHELEEEDGEFTLYKNKLISIYKECNSNNPDDFDAVKLRGVDYKIFKYGSQSFVYDEWRKNTIISCHSDDIIENIKAFDSKYIIYTLAEPYYD